MAGWARLTEQDGSHVHVNMENVSRIRRGKGEQTTTVFFVSEAGNEVYLTVRELPDQML
jgi:putative heme iron utilization protein